MNERPLIAIARGGYSGESVVSMASAGQMMSSADHERFRCIYLTIDHNSWNASDKDEQPLPLERGSMEVAGKRIDAVLIAIHGSPGEDGLLQGFLDMLNIPYQTGDVLNMSLTFSKFSTTAMLRQLEFDVAGSVLLNDELGIDCTAIINEVGLPCFVKPDRSGSSLGISKVTSAEELQPAIELAFKEGSMVMVEKAISGRELTCGIIQLNGEAKALPVCEVITDREYFDFEAKYHAKGTQEIVPAEIPADITKLCQQRSLAIFNALDCKGLARIDYFLTDEGLVTIEVNTVPGFSPQSIVPKMLRVDGMGIEAAVNGLIEGMLGRAGD